MKRPVRPGVGRTRRIFQSLSRLVLFLHWFLVLAVLIFVLYLISQYGR